MTEILTASEMRALEQRAMDSGAVTGLTLMERAGQGVVDAVLATWPVFARTSYKAVVLCGPGNNGGDGFVIARLLHRRGWDVDVWFYGDPARLPPDARVNYDRWCTLGAVRARTGKGSGDAVTIPIGTSVVIDALFGIGLSRPLGGPFPQLAQSCAASAAKIVAVDMPSGLCSESGRPLGAVVRADLTVTFDSPKPGHVLGDGPDLCSRLAVTDIGLETFRTTHSRPGKPATPARAMRAELVPAMPDVADRRVLSARAPAAWLRRGEGHKYSHGHAVVVTGGMGRTGAARLAAQGALRIGAGLVTVFAPGAAMMECACQLTEVMLRRCDDAAALGALLEDDRLNAVCLGPGLGLDRARALVPVALGQGAAPGPVRDGTVRRVLLDADALSAYADAPEVLFAMLHDACVLTPHAGEFARLFPDLAAQLSAPEGDGPGYSKIAAVRAAAARAGCVVLLKGRDTVIADPDGRVQVHLAAYGRAAPGLATAGSGDVLAGFITGLLARSVPPLFAASTGAWAHVEAARAFGPGLIASDLPQALPAVLAGRDL